VALNQEIVNFAFWKLNVVDETQVPTAVQASTGLTVLNDMLANQAADGMRLGWWPQTNLAATAPLRASDIEGVKYMLTRALAAHYGITLKDQLLIALINDAERQLTKRSLRYMESDLGELQRAQGGPWGGPNWI
jgi:hypothetical protein